MMAGFMVILIPVSLYCVFRWLFICSYCFQKFLRIIMQADGGFLN